MAAGASELIANGYQLDRSPGFVRSRTAVIESRFFCRRGGRNEGRHHQEQGKDGAVD